MVCARCHDIKFALQTLVVVVPNIVLDHLNQFFSVRERPPVVALAFQDTPETFHWSVIYAMADTGHALRHAVFHELCMERAARVLEASVAVEQGMRSRILGHCLIKRIEHETVIVMVAYLERYDPLVAEVEDSAQVELVRILNVPVFELRDVRYPFLIWFVCMKLPVQDVLCRVLRMSCGSRAAVMPSLYARLDAKYTHEAQSALVVDTLAVCRGSIEVIGNPAVALGWVCLVKFLDLSSQPFVLLFARALFATLPVVIGRARDMR